MPKPSDAVSASFRRAEWLLALAVALLLVLLQVHAFMQRGGFWRDEVDLINLSAQQNPIKHIRPDSFPVFMSVAIRGWTGLFGGSDLALRGLGLLIGISGLGALWGAGNSLRQAPPLIGLILFGLNATVIAFDQAMRAYGLGSALIIAYLAAMWSYLQKPSALRLLLLLVFALLSVQTLFQNAVLIAAISLGAWVICLRRKRSIPAIGILLVGLVAAASLKPYLGGIMSAHESSVATAGISPRGWRDFLPFADLMAFPLTEYRYVWAALLGTVVISGIAQLWNNCPQSDSAELADARLFGGVTALAALAGFVWFFHMVNTPTQPWHFLPLLAALSPLLDLAPLPRRQLARTIVFGLLVASALVSTAFAYRDLQVRLSNLDVIAAKLKTEATARDYIVVTPWYCGISYNRYHQSPAPWDTLPPVTNHWLHHYPLVQEFMGDTNALRSVEEKIRSTLQQGGRVWVAGQLDLPAPEQTRPIDLPPPPLEKTGWGDTPYNLVWSWQIGYFLTAHATNFGEVTLPAIECFHGNEKLNLLFAEGWRDQAAVFPPASASSSGVSEH